MKNFSIEKLESRRMCTSSDYVMYPDYANDTGFKSGFGQGPYGMNVTATEYTATKPSDISGFLELWGGATVKLQTNFDTFAITSLGISPRSLIDIGTNRMIIHKHGNTETYLRNQIKAGCNRGLWNGSNGISSSAITSTNKMSVGYIMTNDVDAPSSPWTPDPSVLNNAGHFVIAYAAPGDTNLDGCLDLLDVCNITSSGKFGTGKAANWQQGDTNYDGVCDLLDISSIIGVGLYNKGSYLAPPVVVPTSNGSSFDPSLAFAALAVESGGQATMRPKTI